jgi:RNA polymerase sigma-70 factor (ECF subfamily)
MEELNRQFSDKAMEDFRLIDEAVNNNDEQAFAKAFRSLHRFKKDFTFSTWLFRIATNNTIDHIRKKKLNTLSIDNTFTDDNGDGVSIEVEDENLNPQEETIKRQKAELIQVFVDKLPPKYQKLVRLRYFSELSYEEIAVELEAPLGTVKAQLHRARELMFEMVKNKRDHI